MAANKERLEKIFKTIDLDGDGVLNANEIKIAMEKAGEKPSLTEVHAMIAQVDMSKNGVIEFDEFCNMVELVHQGKLPRTTGIPFLIKGAWEDYIQQINKPVEKNKVLKTIGGKGGGVANPEAPQGSIYKIEKKGPARKVYKGLPPKTSLKDLP